MFFKKKQSVPQSIATSVLDSSLQALAKSKVFAISLNEKREFTGNDGSAEAMQNYLDENARETASDQERQLFCFNVNGGHIYPVFTTGQKVQEWIGKKPFPWNGATAVTLFEFQAPKLFRRFAGAPLSVLVVLDPMSDNERVLSHEELQALAQL